MMIRCLYKTIWIERESFYLLLERLSFSSHAMVSENNRSRC